VGLNGEVNTWLSGPIWDRLPQTPQAAEHVGRAMAMRLLRGDALLYGDCLGVHRAALASPKEKCRPRAAYAGILRDVLAYETAHFAKSHCKVKAHQSVASVSGQE